MAYSPVETFAFSGGAGVDVITTYPTLGTIDGTTSGYLKQNAGGQMYCAFGTSTPRLLRGAGTYTNDQYAEALLHTLTTGFSSDWANVVLQADAGAAPSENYYTARVSNGTTKTTQIIKVVSGSPTTLASSTSIAWASGDKILVEIVSGVISVYRDTGGGYGSAVLSHDDSGSSPLTGGKPGFGMTPTSGAAYYMDDVELGDVTSGGGSSIAAISNHYRKLRT